LERNYLFNYKKIEIKIPVKTIITKLLTKMTIQPLRFYFKLVYTSNTWYLDINGQMSTIDFVNWVNSDDCHILFNIHDQYHIQVVETNTNPNGDAEMGPPIMVSFTDTIAQRFNPRVTSFYLRPVHQVTSEFIRRDDYSVAPTPEIVIEHLNQQVNSDDAQQMI
jgi:hypothetical protein